MVDNILKARDNGVVSDIGVQRPGGDYAVAAFDEDAYNKLVELLTEIRELNDSGAVNLTTATVASIQQAMAAALGVTSLTITNLQSDALTNTELRATDVQVNDDVAHARLASIITELQSLNAFDNPTESTALGIKSALDGVNTELDSILLKLGEVLTELSNQQKDSLTDTELRLSAVVVDNQHDQPVTQAQLAQALEDSKRIPTLTERMFAKRVETGYQLWLDTSDTSHLYTAEGPVGGDPALDATWRGVRVTLDATGFPNGPVEVADGFVWDNRTSFGGWA